MQPGRYMYVCMYVDAVGYKLTFTNLVLSFRDILPAVHTPHTSRYRFGFLYLIISLTRVRV